MNLKIVVFIGIFLSLELSMARAETFDPAFEALLKQQVDINEGVQIQQIMPVELDGSVAGAEQVVLWTIMGPRAIALKCG